MEVKFHSRFLPIINVIDVSVFIPFTINFTPALLCVFLFLLYILYFFLLSLRAILSFLSI